MNTYLIFCNGNPEEVVVGNENQATARAFELKTKHFHERMSFYLCKLEMYHKNFSWTVKPIKNMNYTQDIEEGTEI